LPRTDNRPRGIARAVPAAGRWLACCLLGVLLSVWAGAARSAAELSVPIVSQPLAKALVEFAHQTGLQLLYESKLAAQRQSHEAPAGLSATDALTQLLRGTGLNFQFLNPRTVRIYEPAAVAPAAQPPTTEVPKPRAEPAARRVDTLEEILVTGTRRGEHLSDLEDVQNIPASVSVVSGVSLEAEKAVQLSDYSANLPGVNIIGGGMPGASGVAIRGVSPLAQATSVAFYLDDVPIGASARWGYAGGTALDLLPYELERIEVQRGPQGTFGGAGAEIGSIKYVLNPPDASQFEARVGADVSTIHGASEPGESVRAMVNAPIVDDLLAIRATAYDSYTPGYIENEYSGAKDINGLRQYGGRVAASWRPSGSLSLTVTAFYNLIKQDSVSEVLSPNVVNVPGTGDAYIVKGVGGFGDLADSLAFLSPFEKRLESFSATLRWNPGFAEFMSVTGWSRNHEHWVQDYSPIDGSYFPALSGGAIPAGLAKIVEDVYLNKLTEELRITSVSRGHIDWVLGAFYTHERLEHWLVENAFDDTYRPIAAFAPNLGFFYRPSSFNEMAAFGDVTWEFSDQFEVAAGIRSARDTQDYSNLATGVAFPQPDHAGQGADTVTDWMASARYRIVPSVMLYGRVSTGSQPNSLIGAQPGTSASDKGETVTNYEVGVKSNFLERRALIDLTLFHLNRDRMLAMVYESGVFHATANGGAATAKGLELTSSYSPLQGFTLGYNAAYTQSAYTTVIPAAQYQLTGYQLKNVPKWDMSITAAYDWALTHSWHAHVGGDFRWVGTEWDSYVQSPAGYPTAALPSYTVLDLNAAIARGPLSLKFFARNLTDKRAYLNSSVIVNDYNTPVQVVNYVLQPRTVGIGFDYTF
jgi:iron complex outermembrane receptor protein